MNQKILFVLNTQEYFRNYITSGTLSAIKKWCWFLVDKKVTGPIANVGGERIIPYTYPADKARLHWHLLNMNMVKFMSRSKTFKFRFMRLSRRYQLQYKFLATPLLYDLVKFYILKKVGDQELEQIISKLGPSLILIPTSGYEGLTFEIIKIAKKLGIPTCLLIDNWDNLCSKTIFTRKPDYLAVWGQQSVEMAERIHDFDKEKIFILGTPRFIQYFRNTKALPSPYPFRFALFAGNAIPFDEISTLKKIDQIIENSNQDIKIVYRPHPWRHPRRCFDTFFEYDFKNVILDTDARRYYKKESDNFSPALSYYPKLLANCQYMICPLSTMLIEGLFFNKKVFVLTYDDGIHFTNPKNAYRYYEHFQGIDNLENVIIIDKFENLNLILKDQIVQKGRRSSNLNYYITNDTKNYPKNLKLMADKIINEWNNH